MLITNNSKFLYLYAFALFILSALYGFLLRWNFTFPLHFLDYKNFLQSHSHVAFLGWGYIVTVGALIKLFVKKSEQTNNIYKLTLFIIITSVTLMLISFPLGGYKVFSIVLLSVFGITSYVLSFKLLKDIKGESTTIKLVKYGIYYYLLSSLATWFLAYVLVTQGKTDLYYNTVYFYLHFLYNGYFVFVLFALLFKIFETKNTSYSSKFQKNFFLFLNIACIPAYALSVLWSKVPTLYNGIGFIASIFQLISLFYLGRIILPIFPQLKWNYLSKLLMKFGLIAYTFKIIVQIFSAFPVIVEKSLALKHYFIIGYLHLFTLGFMSVLLLLILSKLNIFSFHKLTSKIGVVIFLIGILTTEFLLFYQGFSYFQGFKPLTNYNLLLLGFSSFLVIGLILLFINQLSNKKSEIK